VRHRGLTVIVLLVLAVASATAVPAISLIERAGSPVGHPLVTKAFSPNGDGVLDSARIRFALRDRGDAIVTIVDDGGHTIARLPRIRNQRGTVAVSWDGYTDHGSRIAPQARYHAQIELVERHRTIPVQTPITLDVVPPKVLAATIEPPLTFTRGPRLHIATSDVARREVELDGLLVDTFETGRTPSQRHSGSRQRIVLLLRLHHTTQKQMAGLRLRVFDHAGNSVTVTPQVTCPPPVPVQGWCAGG
jgi:hypothetical protein